MEQGVWQEICCCFQQIYEKLIFNSSFFIFNSLQPTFVFMTDPQTKARETFSIAISLFFLGKPCVFNCACSRRQYPILI